MSPPRRRGSRRGCTFPGFPSTRERHSLSCHPHDGGVQPWSRPPWISVYAGMTSSFMSHPQEWESRPGRVLPASHSCGMPYTLVSPPRKRGSSPVVGRRLDSRLRGNDSLFHVTPQEWESRPSRVLPASHSCGMPYTLVSPPRKRGSSPVVGRRLDSGLRGNDSLFHGTPAKEGGQAWSRLPRIPTCAGCHTLLCHPAEAGVQSCRGTSSGFPPSRE